MKMRVVVGLISSALIIFFPGMVSSQEFPNRPIRIITGEAGGNVDFVARLIAQGLVAGLGQQAIVDNRAGGVIPGSTLAKAPPDGYTLLVYGSALWTLPLLRNDVPYDPLKDFLPITLAVSSPNVVVVNAALPAKSIPDLIALAKAKPGELNYASGPTGSSNHLAMELFNAMAGVKIVRVPYKGGGPAMIDLIAGRVHVSIISAPLVAPHVKSGSLRALAVTSAQPSALVPGLPTVAASGLPGYEAVVMLAMFAPAKTPAAVVNRLNSEVVRFLKAQETKEKVLNAGSEVVANSPDQLMTAMKSEMTRMDKVIKDAGIRAED